MATITPQDLRPCGVRQPFFFVELFIAIASTDFFKCTPAVYTIFLQDLQDFQARAPMPKAAVKTGPSSASR